MRRIPRVAASARFSARPFVTSSRTNAIALRTLKRGGQQPHIPLEIETAEGIYQLDPRDDLTPEKLFDRQWALTLLDRVLDRLAARLHAIRKIRAVRAAQAIADR